MKSQGILQTVFKNLGIVFPLFFLGFTQCSDHKIPLKGERHPILDNGSPLVKDPDADNYAVFLPPPRSIVSWDQMGGNSFHSMPHALLGAGSLQIQWKSSIGTGSRSDLFLLAGPVASRGVIYTMDAEGRVEARNTKEGRLQWSFDTKAWAQETKTPHSGGGVSVSRGRVFIASPYGEVIALEQMSGFELWRTPLPYSARSAPSTDGERVYVTTLNNRTVAIDAVTGLDLWQHEGASETTSFVGGAAPAIYSRVVFAPYSTGELFALKAENGHVLWTETLSPLRTLSSTAAVSQLRARPVIHKGMLIVLSQSDRIAAIDARTGRRLWDKEIGGIRTPAVTDEFIFALTTNNHLTCLLRETGQVVWSKSLNDDDGSSDQARAHRWVGPVLAGGFLVVGGANGHLLFLKPEDGAVHKVLELGASIKLSPIVYGGVLYVLTDQGRLVAIQ